MAQKKVILRMDHVYCSGGYSGGSGGLALVPSWTKLFLLLGKIYAKSGKMLKTNPTGALEPTSRNSGSTPVNVMIRKMLIEFSITTAEA